MTKWIQTIRKYRGAWVAQSVECPIVGFSSGYDLMGHGLKLHTGLLTLCWVHKLSWNQESGAPPTEPPRRQLPILSSSPSPSATPTLCAFSNKQSLKKFKNKKIHKRGKIKRLIYGNKTPSNTQTQPITRYNGSENPISTLQEDKILGKF